MNSISLSDRELLRKIMYLKDCTQAELGEQIGIARSTVSNVINQRQDLSRPARMLAEQLLEKIEKEA